MARQHILFVAAIIVSLAAPAQAGRFGGIGDSLSVGMDSDDAGCDSLLGCKGLLKNDWGYSFATGDQLGNSLRRKTGYAGAVTSQYNGARWDDGPTQADQLVAAGDVTHASILLGGNDVCRNLGDTLPATSEIAGYAETTFSKLANGLPYGATVVVSEVPDVVRLWETTRARKHVIFETCQDLWNLDTSRIAPNTCDWGFFDFICDIADFVVRTFADFVSPLTSWMINQLGVKFPCGYVLDSRAPASNRTAARAFNNEINTMLYNKVNEWNARQSRVRFRFASTTFEYQFVSDEISKIDCFHCNRKGQQNLATTIWNGAALGTVGGVVADTGVPYMTTGAAWWSAADGAIDWNDEITFDFDTNEDTTIAVYSYWCDANAWYYEGTTNENLTAHQFKIRGLEYYYYWDVWVSPTDRAGNVGGWYNSGCM